ncbi:MAG TPA: GYF domain-containing protein [Tepidisphaeraceae bacterium]
MNYYLAEGTTQRGPFSEQELAAAGLRPDSMVWREGMPQWQTANQVPELQSILFPQAPPGAQPAPLPMPGPAPVGYATPAVNTYPPYGDISGKKLAAGLCGIILGVAGFGGLGVHKFVLGLNAGGFTMLGITLGLFVLGFLTCGITFFAMPAMTIIALVEGIIYLTKSDAEFYQTYLVHKRQWF